MLFLSFCEVTGKKPLCVEFGTEKRIFRDGFDWGWVKVKPVDRRFWLMFSTRDPFGVPILDPPPPGQQDDEHRFELATQLGKLQMAADIILSISAQAGCRLGGRRSVGVLFGCFARNIDGDSWFTRLR